MVPLLSAAYWAASSEVKTRIAEGFPGTLTNRVKSLTLLLRRRVGGRRSDRPGASVMTSILLGGTDKTPYWVSAGMNSRGDTPKMPASSQITAVLGRDSPVK